MVTSSQFEKYFLYTKDIIAKNSSGLDNSMRSNIRVANLVIKLMEIDQATWINSRHDNNTIIQ